MNSNIYITRITHHWNRKLTLLRTLSLTLLMVAGAAGAWGQTDYSGVYYIANKVYNGDYGSSDYWYNKLPTNERWYLVPAADPQQTNKEDAYYSADYAANPGDPEKPFLTTYQTNRDNNSVWVVKKTGSKYYIIHALTGKYVKYEPPVSGKPNRRSVHLEGIDTDTPGNVFQFTITTKTENSIEGYNIQPTQSNGNDVAGYLNPAGDNWPYYYAHTKNKESIWCTGLVGYYNSTGGGSLWPFEEALLAAPTISCSGSTATVSDNAGLPAGYNVRYTIDGTTPTATSPILPVGGYHVDDPCTMKAVIERYGIVLTAVATLDVEPSVRKPVFTPNADGSVVITTETGKTIYYTLDGTDPTTSTPTYATTTTTISEADVHTATAIKAIAYDSEESQVSSVATLPLATYTYKIINQSKKIAVSIPVQEPVGKPLSGYTSIPSEIRSEYLSGETVTFYSFGGDYAVGATVSQSTIDAENPISATPADDADIYVTYTVTGLDARFLPLSSARPYNIKSGSNYLYNNAGAYATTTSPTEDDKKEYNYLWYVTGSDPYNVQIQNAQQTSSYLTYASSTLGTGGAQTYILKGTANHTVVSDEVTTEDITLRNSSGEEFDLTVLTVKLNLSFTLIDRQGKIIASGIRYGSTFALPSEWQSPLVTQYKYYKNYSELSGGAYSFSEDDRITRADQVTSSIIYVTYDVSTAIDLDGRNSLGIEDKVNKTYRLQFINSANTSFYQENSDAVMTTKRKAVYPYSNGDGALYVYGEEKWQNQLSSGASERKRWLWYIEPANSPSNAAELDPYHVKISSYQTQTSYKISDSETRNFHSYLRTYQPTGHNAIVTGVSNDNPLTFGREASAAADNSLGTEYMILGADLEHCRLQTVQPVGLDLNGDGDYLDDGESEERRTIHSFEQYWKNTPTVQGKLTTKVTALGRNLTLTATQKAELAAVDTDIPWHVYAEWANSQPWVNNGDATPGKAATTGRKYLKEEHAFQTIEMGEDFSFEETTLDPMLILLDQHGWEIARVKLPSGPTDPKRAQRYAEIHKYSSPMVARYHFWKTGSKVPGYHMFTVSDYATNDDGTEYTADELGRADLASSTPNLPNYETQALVSGKERDWYVTYDVKPEYADTYAGDSIKGNTQASRYLLKQGSLYATISGTSLSTTDEVPANPETATDMLWYLQPYFDIDAEMGYKYLGETGAQDEALSKDDTEGANFKAGKNGFDPYNVQIKSVVNANTAAARFFTTNTSASVLSNGAWEGTTSTLSLLNQQTNRQTPTGYDQTEMKVTNATFMVVDDGSGNMVLMPRFDHTKMLNSLTGTQFVAAGTTTNHLELTLVPTTVSLSSDIKAMGGQYILNSNFTVDESVGTAEAPFTGIIDGEQRTYSSTSKPFVTFADGAIIKNIIFDGANVTSGASDITLSETDKTALGTICNYATGDTRIYNCGINGGSVGASADYVGGLVGLLDGAARVINCYSYADITSGSYVGGIVGYNNVATTSSNLKTMVMNCMFYADITGGTNKAPIYNGQIISNAGVNGVGNYNYFWGGASYMQDSEASKSYTYNCALMAETRYLQRFEFFRHLLNSHRELAAWWATGDYSNKDEMMKWVLEPSQIGTDMPFPILKTPGRYPSVVNYEIDGSTGTAPRLGTLSVTVRNGDGAVYEAPAGAEITTPSLTLNITDKDSLHYNFNYRKVQLPYYNDVGTKNYTGNRVVTGWKIVSISGGTTGSFTTGDDAAADATGAITSTPYNFADRNCTAKDLYGTSGRVFNQGAYWDVPEGVTAIIIEPYWAKAAYLADGYADVVYNETMGTSYNVPTVGGGSIYSNGQSYTIDGESKTVYTSIDKARDALGANKSHTVYDYAIVLVGNAHYIGVSSSSADLPYTIMSADFDHDDEPDYSYILRFNSRCQTHPVRLDFINIPGLGMAQKSTGGKGTYNFGICQPIGWFESTNTSLFRVTQFEYDRSNRGAAPLILQGGVIEQWVSGQSSGIANKTTYFHVGGNVWFKEFHRGTHQDNTYTSKHPPISVTGGDYDEFYLTGLYRGDISNYNDNAECYINGGRFGILAGAGQEGIGDFTKNTGNIVWQIQNADIDEFYGGGFNAARPIEGNITTVITGGHIKQFCGGPKFGDMNNGKTVKTTATGCTFDNYYGAGYGGNSYSRRAPSNQNNKININWNNWVNGGDGYSQKYDAKYGGVETQINYQFLPMSGNADNVCRLFVEYVSFSLATARDVTSTLTGCTINNSFYGGGRLGKVDGPVTSTLTNCSVNGSVFGAGFSASLPTVEVMNIGGFQTEPVYNENLGIYLPAVFPATVTYTWEHAETVNSTATAINTTDHILYTSEDLTSLGEVTGTATLNIDGTTTVAGSVYGGGYSSDATGNVDVNVLSGTVSKSVFGGGYGQETIVGGDITVNIGAKDGEGTLTGSGTVTENVYGGSALGQVNATAVNVYGGTVRGNVFGGGLGQTSPIAIAAQNLGNAVVTMEGGTVSNAVYGGANVNGVLKQDATVTIIGGTINTVPGEGESIKNAVFGGGFGQPTLVEGNVTVNIGTKSGSTYTGTATINGHVYGGSALGNVNTSKPAEELVFDDTKKTSVYLYGDTIRGDAYGGGLGQKAGVNGAESNVEAFVGGDVLVELDGTVITGSIFGCNNLNGTPKDSVKVWVKRTTNIDKEKNQKYKSTVPLASRTTYDVYAVYGGGNRADYNPTKANGTDEDKQKAFAEVWIEGCDTTSIQYVYGGGNAAAVPATKITINSCYIIDQLFGGGNGAGTGNPGADVGVIDKAAYALNPANGNYGTGIAATKLVGGKIRYVYGGSNTLGNVRGGTELKRSTPEPGDDCALEVREIYGAGQVAPMDGDVNIILECMPEEFVSQVFGGAKNATINGNVSLTVTSGKYGRVFGGNNEGGSINGSITVNVYEEGCQPLIIGELYGGGYNAPYSIWGCNDDDEDGTWTPNAPDPDKKPHVAEDTIAVSVNVYSCTSVGKVFGGGFGAPAQVVGNTHVYINTIKGSVDGDEQETIGKIGQVFGGGNAAPVKGNVTIDIGTAGVSNKYSKAETLDIGVNITGGSYLKPDKNEYETLIAGVYGGGYSADVDGCATLNIGTAEQNLGVTIDGNVYGGGYGATTHVTDSVTINIGTRTPGSEGNPDTYTGNAHITGDVYGGSALGNVNSSDNTSATADAVTAVTLNAGTITGSLYGGGLGQQESGTLGEDGYKEPIAANVFGPVAVSVYNGTVTSAVYGCNNLNGSPKDSVTVNIFGTDTPESPATYTIPTVYGGGNQAAYNGGDTLRVNIIGGYVNDVFGGGLGTTADVTGGTIVKVSGGTITNNLYGGGSEAEVIGGTLVKLIDGTVGNDLYGGGSLADVQGAVSVALNGGTVARDVYGGGALANTNTQYLAGDPTKSKDTTAVSLAGTTVTGNVYGGGLGRLQVGTEGEGGYVAPVAANVNGPVTVAVTSGTAANVFGCNNLNGTPQVTATVNIGGGSIAHNVYGGGNLAASTCNTTVTMSNGTVSENVFGGGLGSTAVVEANTSVGISGGNISNNVYGGGSEADVTGSVAVNISGGTVVNDVYGGGALANTNTANWNTPGSAVEYVDITSSLTVGTTSVAGYYTRSGSEGSYVYTFVTSGKAEEDTQYYKKKVVGTWVTPAPIGGSSYHTTAVTLTGGLIGNAYGGGLGDATHAANVYGDVTVTVNSLSSGEKGVAFDDSYQTYPSYTTLAGETVNNSGDVLKHGRVFGCNNINGTPTGNVTVSVYATRHKDDAEGENHLEGTYEIQGVYGGGNQSDYLPADGKKTQVNIHGCGETSINHVYGGGSAADVPATDVNIYGAFEISLVFGGGNGRDMVLLPSGTWKENGGANVIGGASIKLYGGNIGDVYGGSNSKGECGTTSISQQTYDDDDPDKGCPLRINFLYGAGNEAGSGGVYIILGGCSSATNIIPGVTTADQTIKNIIGGARKADINGGITLTVTSGDLDNVYGGNYLGGKVLGPIVVNIQETDCQPLKIKNLYGGGCNANYPGDNPAAIYAAHPTFKKGSITVNVMSCTSIGNIYGGGYDAFVDGNTEVNINMTKGNWAGRYYPEEVNGEPNTNPADSIPNSIGTIGNVYGGGYVGHVTGNAVVNIGTQKKVYQVKHDSAGHPLDSSDAIVSDPITNYASIATTEKTVYGAKITGNVYGGGNRAIVNSNTTVNFCTANYSDVAGFEGDSIHGSIYGGGNRGNVEGNTNVTMSGGYVFNGIFGGGLAGSVGTYEVDKSVTDYGHTPNHAGCIGKPIRCTSGGTCTVLVNGGQIGPVTVATQGMTRAAASGGPVTEGWVWGAGMGLIEDPAVDQDTHFKTYVNNTNVTIGGSAFIQESIIGGGEFGRVLGNTLVTIQDTCQIGVGAGQTKDGGLKPKRYTEAQWTAAKAAVTSGNASAIATAATSMPGCSHFPYGRDTNSDGINDEFLPYDPYYDEFPTTHITPGSTASPTDGQTWIGSVWGGGSGYMPYKKADGSGYEWLRSAGRVEGSTKVVITGGHILSNVYGGNEYTDVEGDSCVVIMTGGTIGVPRTKAQIQEHPITGNLYGGGKGDQRSHFNAWTDVKNTRVYVGGTAHVFGSVFGGGEDGHVTDSTKIQIYGGTIGSVGTSSFDGNVFGGGRGFSGTALTAGTIGGNAQIDIQGGTILGNVYGGGRMASVGVDFNKAQDPATGQFTDDGGNVTITIGGTAVVGNDSETSILATGGHTTGGNVYGGGMGRLTMLDGTTPNSLWVKMAQAKSATINISGGTVKSNVYGGAEVGTTRDNATINMTGGTVNGNVYGGGYGSDETRDAYIGSIEAGTTIYRFTPMQYAGCLGGNSVVNISGGTVKNNVYGGGELATVGVIDYSYKDGDFVNIKKHTDDTKEFALSWPYDLPYLKDGKATVTITGGRIGTASVDTTGYVFGGGKGKSMERYKEAFCANVKETEVTINYGSTPSIANEAAATSYFSTASNPGIQGAIYGGGDNGHVMQNAVLKIQGGIIGYSAYAGGKGIDKYHVTAADKELRNFKTATASTPGEFIAGDIYSITAGKVYGNTSLTMTGGYVVRNVYGGGYMASVGKGNYAGGPDDYSSVEHFIYNGMDMGSMCGYGEAIADSLWDSSNANSVAFLTSGKATVTVTGGTVGTVDGIQEDMPTGNVIGGSRGEPAPNVFNMPVHEYNPVFHVGNINEAEVVIGTKDSPTGPRLFGSVYGGGRDGHMRRDSKVTVYSGEIGNAYTSANQTAVGTSSLTHLQWQHRGNVYGSGSGIGKYKFDYQDGEGEVEGLSYLAGCVARFSEVDIQGGTIHRNVYGGGSVAGTGFPKFYGQNYEPYKKGDTAEGHSQGKQSMNTVSISGGTIGEAGYGGNVFGASRGEENLAVGRLADEVFATSIWTKVDITGGTIYNNVYGGGEVGTVKMDTEVNLKGGEIKHNAYGGGKGTTRIPADVGGNVTVKLNEGVSSTATGCIVDKLFGCNDMNGTPKGHALVHVYATQNSAKDDISHKPEPMPTDSIGWANYAYDVTAVYGGGDLAEYNPTSPTDYAQVIIDGCSETSIKQVYGGGNAAPVPATNVRVNACYIINEVFGGGNGLDNYTRDGEWYANLGANVGYHALAYYKTKTDDGYVAATHGTGEDEANRYKAITYANAGTKAERQNEANGYAYGTGWATTTVTGGRINYVYGGSNQLGNVRNVALSEYQSSGTCTLITGKTYGGSKNAEIDAEIRVVMDCVEEGGTYYGGSANSDVNSDVTIDITNGTYEKVFGGNDRSGTINGSITINIRESGCTPIIIGELYGGGNEADYSVYGYRITKDDDGKVTSRTALKKGETGALTTPYRDPQVNIISATRIGDIYGGGYKAHVIGSPHINVNMQQGRVLSQHANKDAAALAAFAEGTHGEGNDQYTVVSHPEGGDAMLAIGKIGNIFGGGNMGDIIGNTYVDIGTGQWLNASGILETTGTDGVTYTYNPTSEKWEYDEAGVLIPIEGTPTPARDSAFITGSVYGGGRMGHVGDIETRDANGKPTKFKTGTGTSTIVISNGEIGPNDMTMYHLNGSGNVPSDDHPDDAGHVFGGGQGTLDYYYDDTTGMTDAEKVTGMAALTTEQMNAKLGKLAYVDTTYVTINGTAFVKGCVFGGAENGHVLHDTHVVIEGDCQIGNGHILLTDADSIITVNRGVNRRYTSDEWAQGKLIGDDDWTANSLPECASWPYGASIADGKLTPGTHHAPYDKFAGTAGYDVEGGRKVASSGRTFFGNVFAGGSGFYPYAPGKWLETAGEVEGNAYVNVTGGHILTSLYGGNEMSSVLGDTYVTMTGGTVGVPRTVAEITAHPVTCYVFGGGKGEARSYLNHDTNVQNTFVDISGGWVYGSVFGGAEDGHVIKDATVTISGGKIGTWGTSYVEGNVFGGGRGFDGHNMFAGCIEGNVTMNISGGEMLGSIYGGGRLGSVGIDSSGKEMADTESSTHGHINMTISGGTIGNALEYKYYTFTIDTAGKAWSAIAAAKAAAADSLNNLKIAANIPQTDFQFIDSIHSGTTCTYIYRLTHTRGGNVFAGGMGRLYTLSGDPIQKWFNLGCVKSTNLIIRQDSEEVPTLIRGNVYGGCELGQVAGTHKVYDAYHRVKGTDEKDEYAWPDTLTHVLIQGGTIGSEIKNAGGETQYTFGSVFGSGYGDPTEKIDYVDDRGTVDKSDDITYESNPKFSSGLVEGGTWVEMTGGTVLGSVFGGGQVANTHGNSIVSVTGGTVGMENMGDLRSGNVYGGGFGNRTIVRCGQIYGNATVTISGTPVIHHHVYGGGAYGSVGQFKYDTRVDPIHLTPKVYGVERLKTRTDLTNALAPSGTTPAVGSIIEPDATGRAIVTITGGTIGTDGLGDGMVFGSSYGDVANPLQRDDFIGWVYDTHVIIGDSLKGTLKGGSGTDFTTPLIMGSVYGSGDNGHTFRNTRIDIHSGTIGLTEKQAKDAEGKEGYKNPNRGNVYGSGNGIETYNLGYGELYKGQAGIVYGNTEVNIDGGLIVHNVYGGGEMASVGRLTNDPQAKDDYGEYIYRDTYSHANEANSFALSWPYEYLYHVDGSGNPVPFGTDPIGGKATVNISGGRIGVEGSYGGDVFGGSQGLAGDRYDFDDMSNVRETEVNINYASTADIANVATLTTPCIAGAVHGGAENGHITEDARVNMDGGLIAHSLYGGGKGKGTYKRTLKRVETNEEYEADIYSLTAGKVYGNTYVTMNGGHVARNVYGGGNMGSVGKGNYSGGPDDYSTEGYGETLTDTDNLWTSTYDPEAAYDKVSNKPDWAYHFLSSGKTLVTINGGTIGYIDAADPSKSFKEGLPYGNVFGGSRGEPAPNVPENDEGLERYITCPSFYSGYVNETNVTIGTLGQSNDDAGGAGKAPLILGSVYGGGQDGHVRRWTHVTVNSGKIGIPYNADNIALMKTDNVNDPLWLYRGSIYGGGSGISEFQYDFDGDGTYNGSYTDPDTKIVYYEKGHSTSSGSVTNFTTVDIKGGTIYRAVTGGGSLGSVGAPKITQPDYADRKTDDPTLWGKQSLNVVNIGGAVDGEGNVIPVTIGEAAGVRAGYGGNVFGGSRGDAKLGGDFGTSIWTEVNILNGSNILGNVFGGGNSGAVMKDTKVTIGEPAAEP